MYVGAVNLIGQRFRWVTAEMQFYVSLWRQDGRTDVRTDSSKCQRFLFSSKLFKFVNVYRAKASFRHWFCLVNYLLIYSIGLQLHMTNYVMQHLNINHIKRHTLQGKRQSLASICSNSTGWYCGLVSSMSKVSYSWSHIWYSPQYPTIIDEDIGKVLASGRWCYICSPFCPWIKPILPK